jgi:hypothetical protein
MGLFNRDKDLERGGLRATAVVQSRRWASTTDEHLLQRSAPHVINLEVHVDGREPYRVERKFDVPKKFWKIARGVELPLLVDPERPERVIIDWDAFEAAGGRQIVKDLGDQYRRDATQNANLQNAVLRENTKTAVEGFLVAVKSGGMSRQEFEGYVDEYVSKGELTAEDGEAFKQRAGEPNPRPTTETHPPVEGVDYETWIRATVGIVRKKIPPSEHAAYYESCGFPAGRGEAISAAWYERVKTDAVLSGWYVQDSANLDLS